MPNILVLRVRALGVDYYSYKRDHGLHRTSRAEVLAQLFHEELWSEGPGARPVHRACYEQVKQSKHRGKKGGSAGPEVRLPDLCPFQMKCGSFINRRCEKRGPSRWQRSKTWRSPSSPQIHQKYIYMWNNSYRTSIERRQKTSDFPKAMWLRGSWYSRQLSGLSL